MVSRIQLKEVIDVVGEALKDCLRVSYFTGV